MQYYNQFNPYEPSPSWWVLLMGCLMASVAFWLILSVGCVFPPIKEPEPDFILEAPQCLPDIVDYCWEATQACWAEQDCGAACE